jgi:esterase/lipase
VLELLQSYSLSEIIIFFIIFCLAIKEAISFYDWGKARLQQGYNKDLKAKEDKSNIQNEISVLKDEYHKKSQEFDESFDNLNKRIDDISSTMKILVKSDKDDIKAYITEKHHLFCYEKKWIDDYSLDCIERRYSHYVEENGNSFVEDLMKELRALPKQPPQE